jgi:hypothetical protein
MHLPAELSAGSPGFEPVSGLDWVRFNANSGHSQIRPRCPRYTTFGRQLARRAKSSVCGNCIAPDMITKGSSQAQLAGQGLTVIDIDRMTWQLLLPEAFRSFLADAILSKIVARIEFQISQVIPVSHSSI